MPVTGLIKRLFLLPPDQLGAAQNWIDHGDRTARKPRYASSVVLVRDSPAGVECYLAFRPGISPLGTVAFPGGSIEESDDEDLQWFGPTPAKWAEQLGLTDHQLARLHVVAAIRELFEETGVLLAGPDQSTLIESVQGEEWMKSRELIASQEKSFASMLNRRGLGLRTDLLRPLSNWQSPDFAHRRFDTRYFAAALPINQAPRLLGSKGVWGRWCSAAEVVAQRLTTALGDEVGQPNTVGLRLSEITVPAVEVTLEKIATARGVVAYLSNKRPLKVYHPALVQHEGGLYLEVEYTLASEGGSAQRGR